MDVLSIRDELNQELAQLTDAQVSIMLQIAKTMRSFHWASPEDVAQSEFYNSELPAYDGDLFPEDYSVNLEHYLYGADKQEP